MGRTIKALILIISDKCGIKRDEMLHFDLVSFAQAPIEVRARNRHLPLLREKCTPGVLDGYKLRAGGRCGELRHGETGMQRLFEPPVSERCCGRRWLGSYPCCGSLDQASRRTGPVREQAGDNERARQIDVLAAVIHEFRIVDHVREDDDADDVRDTEQTGEESRSGSASVAFLLRSDAAAVATTHPR